MMIRAAHPQFAGLGGADYRRGAAPDSDLRLDVDVLHRSQTHCGLASAWWAGHRNGASGLTAPGTPDIRNYHMAVEWIRGKIASRPAHTTDDTRFFVKVPAI
jgi:hypothetical protein